MFFQKKSRGLVSPSFQSDHPVSDLASEEHLAPFHQRVDRAFVVSEEAPGDSLFDDVHLLHSHQVVVVSLEHCFVLLSSF